MEKLTNSQTKLINRINDSERYEITKITTIYKGMISVTVETVNKHILLLENHHLFVGPRGGVEFASVNSLSADKKHQKVLASLLCFAAGLPSPKFSRLYS